MSSYHFATLDGGSPIGELLDLIARKAPYLMRCGGGALPAEKMCRPRKRHKHPLSAQEVYRIQSLRRDGMKLADIAATVQRRTATVGEALNSRGA